MMKCDMSTGVRLRYSTVDMMLSSLNTLVRSCVAINLECRRSPTTTTRLLRRLGYNTYQVKRFWEEVELLNHNHIPVYKSSFAEFDVKFIVDEGPLYETVVGKYIIPIDENDLSRVGRYMFASKAHRLYLRLVGRAGGYIDINLVRVLSLAERRIPGLTSMLADSVRSYLRDEDTSKLEEALLQVFESFGEVLSLIIPSFPRSLSSLRNLIPLLRRITG